MPTPGLTTIEHRLQWANPLSFPDGFTYDVPIDGRVHRLSVPKDPVKNFRWRERLRGDCEQDEAMQETVRAVCMSPHPNAFLWWMNAWAWTYVQLKHHEDGGISSVTGADANQPFVTWMVQDKILTDAHNAIMGGKTADMGIEKSRDMGLSWCFLALFHKLVQFHRNVNFLEVSRKEALVDSPGDPDSLFWKHDYLNRMQPKWLQPKWDRAKLRLVNKTLDSSIMGQATSSNVGHGGRKTAAFFDEAARMREFKTVWEGASSMTGVRIANSTPHGPGFFSQIVRSDKVKTLRAPWWDHPDKGRGRREVTDPVTGRVKITSPWYEEQVARAVSRREVAENLDMDHIGAGMIFFDTDVIQRQIATMAVPPTYKGEVTHRDGCDAELVARTGDLAKVRWRNDDHGALSVFSGMVEDSDGRVRLPQDQNYVIGADIGQGLEASNSVMSVVCVETREKVAEWVSAQLPPESMALAACLLGWWVGGARGYAFMAWERNGPGGVFGKTLVHRYQYPHVLYETVEDERTRKKKKKLGWWSSEVTKPEILGEYRGALARNEFINRSEHALEEATQYVYYESGSVGPGELEEESPVARKTHGDRVIADAVANHAMKFVARCKPEDRPAPVDSMAYRRREAERQEREDARNRVWRKRPENLGS